jgi:sulfate permease, SulP family
VAVVCGCGKTTVYDARAFKPKLITVLREGYGWQAFGKDAFAGLTVAVVALPLSMAIAIACGLPPATGLVTAVVGGLVVSAVGGSRFQVGGPAGAFIVPVATTLAAHGLQGLVLATFLSGLFLVLAGGLRLGRFVRLIPHAVVLGFSAAIALIIAASQIHDLFGLSFAGKEPAALLPKLAVLFEARGSFSWAATLMAVCTIGLILGLRRINANFPGMLIAVVAAAIIVLVSGLRVETLGDRFGEMAGVFPPLRPPPFDGALLVAVLPAALSFTVLGAVESLLSATVADTMTERHHRPEAELVGQGFANIASALFGGFCVTGTIARTATNIRAGARGPVAGMLHAIFVLMALLLAMPLAAHIPFAALAGVLAVVAFNMVERHEIIRLFKADPASALTLAVTLVGVAVFDLMAGIAAGCATHACLVGARKLSARPSQP